MSNIFPKEESTRVSQRATAKINFSVPSGTSNGSNFLWLHSTFKEFSNEYSHAQIRVKTKKLWPRQVGEEKQVAVQKLSRLRKLSRPGNLVATKKTVLRPKNCHDQETWSQPKKTVSRSACCIATRNVGEN